MVGHIQELLHLIYDGPLEAKPWESFLRKLRTVMNVRIAAVTLYHPADGTPNNHVTIAGPEDPIDWMRAGTDYKDLYINMDPMTLDKVSPGEIVAMPTSEFALPYKTYLTSMEIAHQLRMAFAEPGGTRCWLDVVRSDTNAPFDQRDTEIFCVFLPHLERALKLYAAIMGRETEKCLYEQTSDHIALGSILLNGNGEIMHLNQAATAILKKHTDIFIAQRKLTLADKRANGEFENAVKAATAAQEKDQPPHGVLVRMKSRDGALIGFLVSTVPLLAYYQGKHVPHAIVYISDLTQHLEALQHPENTSLQLIAKLFDLTKQEAKLVLLLADGLSLAEAATTMHIAEASARNYSKRIYQTMGIKRQADLVRLVYRSLALLG